MFLLCSVLFFPLRVFFFALFNRTLHCVGCLLDDNDDDEYGYRSSRGVALTVIAFFFLRRLGSILLLEHFLLPVPELPGNFAEIERLVASIQYIEITDRTSRRI